MSKLHGSQIQTGTITTDQLATAPPSPATTVVAETTASLSAAVGTSGNFAREDHTHGTPAAGGGSTSAWDQDWSNDGSTYTGFTTGSGTWSSSGSYVSCTAPGSGTFARSAISSTPWSALGLCLLKWEMYIPSGQALGGSSGMVMFTSSSAGNGQPIFRLDGSTSAVTGATIENDGTAGLVSKSLSAALDTWLTCHLLMASGRYTGYVAGVPVVTHYASLTSPANNTNVYPALVSYQQAARFRNMKGYRIGGLP